MNKIMMLISLLMLASLTGCIPNTPEAELHWCFEHNPQFNSSTIVGIDTTYKRELGIIQQKCFTEHWAEYCKVSYPTYCPGGKDHD